MSAKTFITKAKQLLGEVPVCRRNDRWPNLCDR